MCVTGGCGLSYPLGKVGWPLGAVAGAHRNTCPSGPSTHSQHLHGPGPHAAFQQPPQSPYLSHEIKGDFITSCRDGHVTLA